MSTPTALFAYWGFSLGHVPGVLSERYISAYVEGAPCRNCHRAFKLRGTNECSACGGTKTMAVKATRARGSYTTHKAAS